MRRLAFAFAFVWLIAAFCVRLIDMRRPGLYISALTGGQQGEQVTIAVAGERLPILGLETSRFLAISTRLVSSSPGTASA